MTEGTLALTRLLYNALLELTLRVDDTEMADGSNMQTYQAHAAIEAAEAFGLADKIAIEAVRDCGHKHHSGRVCILPYGHVENGSHHYDAEGIHWQEGT